MKSNEHIKKFQPGVIPKCAKNQIWEAGDKNWSLGPASTGSMQKPVQTTIILRLSSFQIIIENTKKTQHSVYVVLIIKLINKK